MKKKYIKVLNYAFIVEYNTERQLDKEIFFNLMKNGLFVFNYKEKKQFSFSFKEFNKGKWIERSFYFKFYIKKDILNIKILYSESINNFKLSDLLLSSDSIKDFDSYIYDYQIPIYESHYRIDTKKTTSDKDIHKKSILKFYDFLNKYFKDSEFVIFSSSKQGYNLCHLSRYNNLIKEIEEKEYKKLMVKREFS